MHLSPEASQAIQTEVKQFATDLHLSDEQKARLKSALEGARQKIEEIKKAQPNITKEDVMAKVKAARAPVRERLTGFLTPEQLTMWDAEVAKAKSFLGYTA